jgi:organic radical activating enzyme
MKELNFNPAQETIFLSEDRLFYTIEGEGEYIGQPSVFMRMSMCNLTCKGFASESSPHGCDSYVSWSVKNKMTFESIWNEFFVKQKFADKLNSGAILKYSGGEPMIQQKQLLKFTEYLVQQLGMHPKIDFETNATLMPDEAWVKDFNASFTTSPKLTTNGDAESKTYVAEVLRWHARHYSGFKFVINSDKDIEEIWRKYVDDDKGINVDTNRIWFMPCCGSRQEHIERAPAVAEYAKAMNVNFSPRLHLLVWDQALKV